MTATFAVDATNDLYIDKNGNLAILGSGVPDTQLQAVLQNCEHAAKTILGEEVLNTDAGIPYFQTVWNGVPNLQQFQAALRSAFLDVAGVVEVVSLVVAQGTVLIGQNDNLAYTAVIRTIYGGGLISG